MTDWRALCAELLGALENEGHAHWPGGPDGDPLIEQARAALAAEPTITRQPEFPGQVVWEQGSTLGIAPDEQTARTDAARAVEPLAAQRTDVAPLQVALARVERLADDFSSACRPLVELAEKLAAGPVAEKAPVVPISALLHPAYEPGDGSADGAQMVEMAWWHPVMGCDSLQIVVDNARAALAQPESEVVGPTDEELLGVAAQTIEPYDEIRLDEYEPENNCAIEVYGSELIAFARAVLGRWGRPSPAPAEGEGLTDKELFRIASDCQALYIADDVDYDNCSEVVAAMRAAIAADRARYSHQPAPPDAGEVGELARSLHHASDALRSYALHGAAEACTRAADLLEQRHPAPVPVSERLPGPEDCDAEGRCWLHQPHEACPESPAWELMLAKYASANYEAVCWLPATALPLPSGEGEA